MMLVNRLEGYIRVGCNVMNEFEISEAPFYCCSALVCIDYEQNGQLFLTNIIPMLGGLVSVLAMACSCCVKFKSLQ